MLLLKKSLDLCEPRARTLALRSVGALVQIEETKRPIVAHRVYVACRAQDGERGYFKKKIEPSYFENEDQEELEEYRAARALDLD